MNLVDEFSYFCQCKPDFNWKQFSRYIGHVAKEAGLEAKDCESVLRETKENFSRPAGGKKFWYWCPHPLCKAALGEVDLSTIEKHHKKVHELGRDTNLDLKKREEMIQLNKAKKAEDKKSEEEC